MLLVFSLSFNCRLTREGEESEMSENNLERSSTVVRIFIQNCPLHLEIDCINKLILSNSQNYKALCQVIYFEMLNIIFISILLLRVIKKLVKRLLFLYLYCTVSILQTLIS